MTSTTFNEWIQIRARPADEHGASLVEYALLLALIALVCVTAITYLGGSANNSFDSTGSSISNAT